jgi:hypothetical protein
MGYLSLVIRPIHWVAAAVAELVYSPPVAAAAAVVMVVAVAAVKSCRCVMLRVTSL